MSIPPTKELYKVFFDEDEAVSFLLNENIIYPQPKCETCGGNTIKYNNLWRCSKKTCRKSISIFKNSFFSKTKISACDVLYISYLWLCGNKPISIIIETGLSSTTVTAYIKYIKQLITDNVRCEKQSIGGPGIIVEIDETKMGKRKYHRGHRVEGVWVFGGVERTSEKRVFLVDVPDRKAVTLLKYIKKYVKHGSIIYSDMFCSYSNIEEALNLMHFTVNHSEHYVDPVTGVHTNTIEGTWNGLKFFISPRNRCKTTIKEDLRVFMWRRHNKFTLWMSFLDLLRKTAYYN